MPLDESGCRQDRTPLVSLRGIVKKFGAFTANDHIDLDLYRGRIHALLGENGAGKSTLVKILYGLISPTAGEILWQGRAISLSDPQAARALGIGMVFQHFSLFGNLTVAENIAIAMPKGETLASVPDKLAMIGERYGLKLDPKRYVWTLSAGERQRIEIARCLLQDPQLLILDEPTSVLTPQEADALFVVLERLRDEGRALLYISHKLDEVQRLCDEATILRQGKRVAWADPRVENPQSLASLMVGQQVGEIRKTALDLEKAPFLQVERLTMPAHELHGVALQDISFCVRSGEILGIAGVAGNGQSELFEVLSGERLADQAQSILMDGVAVGRSGINERRLLQGAFVPEERNGHAAVPNLSLAENVVLSHHANGKLSNGWFLMPKAAQALARKIVGSFDVRSAERDTLAGNLSGGNLQKFICGREIVQKPRLLIFNQPTWGVDVLAAAAIRQAIVDEAREGAAVVVISQDLDELFAMSASIAVLHHGHLSEPKLASALGREDVGALMAGIAPVGLPPTHISGPLENV